MKLLFFISALLPFGHSFSQTGNMVFSFAGNTKEVIKANKITREEVYTYSFNKKGIKDSTLIITYSYDTLGDLIEQKAAKSVQPIYFTIKYDNEYYPSGKLRRQIENNRDMNMINICEYEYDSAGNEIFEYKYDKDTTRLTIEQKVYNEKRQVVQLLNKFNNGPYFISRRYYYNNDGELARAEALDNSGELIYTDSYEYDNSLNKKMKYLENSEGKTKIKEYYYNDDKQCIKETGIHKSLSSFNGTIPTYKNSDELIENIYKPDKTVFESNVYINGKKIQMTRHFYFTE